MTIQFRRVSGAVLTAAVTALLVFAATGCGKKEGAGELPTFDMGFALRLGPLTFTALNTEWRDQLEASTGARIPKNRFLIINISATNGGGEETGIPLLTLVDAKGNEFREEEKGDGVGNWLGLLRPLKPADTMQGALLFDVPPGAYKLRVRTTGDPEKEVAAYVSIPFQIDTAPPAEKAPI